MCQGFRRLSTVLSLTSVSLSFHHLSQHHSSSDPFWFGLALVFCCLPTSLLPAASLVQSLSDASAQSASLFTRSQHFWFGRPSCIVLLLHAHQHSNFFPILYFGVRGREPAVAHQTDSSYCISLRVRPVLSQHHSSCRSQCFWFGRNAMSCMACIAACRSCLLLHQSWSASKRQPLLPLRFPVQA